MQTFFVGIFCLLLSLFDDRENNDLVLRRVIFMLEARLLWPCLTGTIVIFLCGARGFDP